MEKVTKFVPQQSTFCRNEPSKESITEQKLTNNTEEFSGIEIDDTNCGPKEEHFECFRTLNIYEPTLFYVQKINKTSFKTETRSAHINSETIPLAISNMHTESLIQACFVAFLARVSCESNVHVGILTENNCQQRTEMLHTYPDVMPCIFEIDQTMSAYAVVDVCRQKIERTKETLNIWKGIFNQHPDIRNRYSSLRHNLVIGCKDLHEKALKICTALVSFQCKNNTMMKISYTNNGLTEDIFSHIIDVLRHFSEFLVTINTTGSMRQLKNIPLISDEEMALLYDPFISQTSCKDQVKDISEIFESQCLLTPLGIAVKTSSRVHSYKSLLSEVQTFQSLLSEVLPSTKRHSKEIVAVHLPSSVSYITAILALAKCKVAFLPIPIDLPTTRKIFSLKDSHVRSMIISSEQLNKCDFSELRQKITITAEHQILGENVLLMRFHDEFSDKNEMEPSLGAGDCDVLYVMYTSGSTGRPKGVKVKQAGVLNMTRAQITCLGIVCEDVIVQFASIGFDASVSEIFTALLSGATVAILDGSERHGRRFISAMNQMKVTVVTLPPSALNIYSPRDLPFLRIVVAAGEVCTSNIANKWTFARNVSFFNAYGPTECTVCTTMYKFYSDALQEDFNYDLPIGRAIDGVKVLLFDQFMNPIPPGVIGEIYIGGHGVSNGYIGHARHLTQERFIQSPLTNAPYTLYKSGDLGFQDLKGTVTFVGRIDEQVKLRGHRIDLDEIEQVLIQFDKVESAVAVVHMCSVTRDLTIAAFVSPKCLDVYDIREYATKALPKYMIPTFFKQIDVKELPLTINGKIDRKRLQQDESIHEMIEDEGDTYLDETQQIIARHWCRIFSLDGSFLKKMQKSSSFSQLGGNSLQLVLLLRHIEEDCNLALPFAEFAILDTIKEFADAFQQNRNKSIKLLSCSADQECELRKNIYQDSHLNSHFHFHHVDTASILQEHKCSLYHQYKSIKHIQKILISGVTGFLGAFLLSEILQQSDFLVFCMVRGTTEHKGMERLVSNMKLYGLWESDYQSRIRVILSDNSKENLGIEEESYEFLCREIDVVFMNAAQMNFNMSYDCHRAVNVLGTKEFIKLASKGRRKYLFFTSSLSVFLFPSKKEFKNGTRNTFLESDIFEDPMLLKTGYGQSKWVCERLVFQALVSLPGGAIFRPARISGRSSDGVGPTNDLFARTVYGIKKLGSYPCIDFPYDLIPVDFCAKSMIEIAIKQSYFDEGTNEIVYHLYNKDTIPFRHLFDGLGLKCLPLDDWRMEIKHADADNELVPLTPFFMSEFWEYAPYWPIFDTNNLDNAISESAKQLLKPASELWQIYKRYFGV